jgi:hypothetical protein
MQNVAFHEVDAARWDDLERLFESRGGPKSCWCMVWRAGVKTAKGPDRKAAMRRNVCEGIPIGLLGYSDGEPVAWCSIAPRTTYRNLGGPTSTSESPEEVWSLVCFFIRREFRGKGLTNRVIAGLDPAIHPLRKQSILFAKSVLRKDGPAGDAGGWVSTDSNRPEPALARFGMIYFPLFLA